MFEKIKSDTKSSMDKSIDNFKSVLSKIRAGRPKNIKDKLISELKNVLLKESKLDETQVWVYIIDLPPSQMIEYGAVLPESGKELQWFKGLSNKLKKKLSQMEK